MGKEVEEKQIYVAVDLGNTKILAMAAERTEDGRLHIIGEETENTPSDAIRYGIICNNTEVVRVVNSILMKLNNRVKLKAGTSLDITKFYVNVNGRTLRSRQMKCIGHSSKKGGVAFSDDVAKNLMQQLRFDDKTVRIENADFTLDDSRMPTNFVLDILPTDYYLDGVLAFDPMGKIYTSIEAHYIAIESQRTLCENFDAFEKKIEKYKVQRCITSHLMGDIYLTPDEKQMGTALIDFGAKCTTLCIYYGGHLAHVSCLPLGGYDITHDLMIYDSRLDIYSAKILKGLGNAIVDKNNKTHITLPNIEGTSYEHRQIDAIINARQSEIFGYIAAEIKKAGFADKLQGGAVITGGASVVNGFDELFTQMVTPKIRHLNLKDYLVDGVETYAKRENAMVISMLLGAKDNCLAVANAPRRSKSPKKGFFGSLEGFFTEEL